jgi:hypothetical protein
MGERDTTGAIGSMRLLPSGQSHKSIAGRLDPRGRKTLAPVLALILAAGAFVFFGGEARAQQSEPQHTSTTYEIAVEQTTEAAPLETSRIEKPLVETSLVEATPAGKPAPVDRQDPETPSGAETAPPIPNPLPGSTPPEEPGLGTERNLASLAVPAPEPVEPELPALKPEPLSLEESAPLSSLVEETPVPETAVPGTEDYLPLGPEDPVDSVAEPLENAVSDVSKTFAEVPPLPPIAEDGGLIDAASANLLPGGEANRVPASERTEDTAPLSARSTAPENPSDGVPQPVSPLAPPLGGSSFSGSGSQTGLGGGGFAPLLLVCVLASGLVLLRRDGLLRWASCETPKPSSALLAPLERPG